MSYPERWSSSAPESWGKAISVYEKYWDPQKKVRVDKSPPNINKVDAIIEYYKNNPKGVAFITMTTSFCFVKSYRKTDILTRKEILAHGIEAARRANFSNLVLKYEDFLKDPYSISERLLNFLPQLRELDPAVNNLTELKGKRSESVVDYILDNYKRNSEQFAYRAELNNIEMQRVDEQFGYVFP